MKRILLVPLLVFGLLQNQATAAAATQEDKEKQQEIIKFSYTSLFVEKYTASIYAYGVDFRLSYDFGNYSKKKKFFSGGLYSLSLGYGDWIGRLLVETDLGFYAGYKISDNTQIAIMYNAFGLYNDVGRGSSFGIRFGVNAFQFEATSINNNILFGVFNSSVDSFESTHAIRGVVRYKLSELITLGYQLNYNNQNINLPNIHWSNRIFISFN